LAMISRRVAGSRGRAGRAVMELSRIGDYGIISPRPAAYLRAQSGRSRDESWRKMADESLREMVTRAL
jgi:hypothetical protein